MSSWEPQITRIQKLVKHPNADALEIATVNNDFPVIVKLGDFKVGDLVSWICIDSIVPDNKEFYFLAPVNKESRTPKYNIGEVPEKYRTINAKKIRGIFSMGLIKEKVPHLNEGDSIIEHFGLKKLEEQDEEENIASNIRLRGRNAKSAPKGWLIPHYDIKSVRKYFYFVEKLTDQEFVISEKLNGSNFSACHDGNELWVKSRNYYKKEDEEDSWWKAANLLNLKEKLIQYPNLAFFGELVGYNSKFRYSVSIGDDGVVPEVYFFDIYDTKNNKYLDYDEFNSIINKLELKQAPVLHKGLLPNKEELYKLAEGNSTIGKHLREGFVLKPLKEMWRDEMQSRFILKLVGEGYSLSK